VLARICDLKIGAYRRQASPVHSAAGFWKRRPEEIGVQLTEGMMMDPEASVSSLVFHHLDCTYFSVGDASEP
jgi:hypothetical protein